MRKRWCTYSLESRSAVVAACLALGIAATRGDVWVVWRVAHCDCTVVGLRLAYEYVISCEGLEERSWLRWSFASGESWADTPKVLSCCGSERELCAYCDGDDEVSATVFGYR